jgi:Outer membrane efflux protein
VDLRATPARELGRDVMKRQIVWVSVLFALGAGRVTMAGQTTAGADRQEHGAYAAEGPPLTLKAALGEGLSKNLDLAALRAQVQVTRERPAQERSLMPPMLEGTIWQWPVNTLNPANTNMYMFMVGQDLPGRGKRELRAAVAEKDIALAQTDVTIRTRQVVNDVKQAYATLFIARKATEVHLANVDLLRQIADVSQAKYATGRISQQDVLKPVVELSKLHADLLMFEEQAGIAAARTGTAAGADRPPAPRHRPSTRTAAGARRDRAGGGRARVRQASVQTGFHGAGWLHARSESVGCLARARRRDVAEGAVVARQDQRAHHRADRRLRRGQGA